MKKENWLINHVLKLISNQIWKTLMRFIIFEPILKKNENKEKNICLQEIETTKPNFINQFEKFLKQNNIEINDFLNSYKKIILQNLKINN